VAVGKVHVEVLVVVGIVVEDACSRAPAGSVVVVDVVDIAEDIAAGQDAWVFVVADAAAAEAMAAAARISG
jgi:hypothetical protein